MKALVVAFLIAACVAAALTPLVRAWALRIGAVSTPGGRHVQERRVPRLGGVAVFVAFTLPLVGLFLSETSVAMAFRAESSRVAGLLAGGFLMCAVGVLDDTRRVRALYKLAAQLVAAQIAWVAGFRILAVDLPLFGTLQMGVFALPITTLWIVGITNAINLIDGLDGLAGGVVFFAAFTNLLVAYLSGGSLVALLMAAVLGSVLGFLFYNFNPARIFMGDSGSYFLGYVLATTSLAGSSQKASTAVSLLVPILALGVPIFDTLFAMVRRFLERRSIFSPDRGHIHHRLLDMGLTHRRAVLMLYGVSIICTVSAIFVSLGRNWSVGVALLMVSVAVTGIIRFTGYFQHAFDRRRQQARLRTRHAEALRVLVPEMTTLFARPRSQEQVLDVLAVVAARAGLCGVELLDGPSLHEGNVTRAWRLTEHGDPESPDVLRARYPLGREDRAIAGIRFLWHGDHGEVTPQEEILLQLVVDVLARRLESLGSPLVPRAAEPAPTPPSRSAAVEATS